jgi:hypothetical protein
MYDYFGEQFWGTDGKHYLIGYKRLDYPMGHNNANYEVRYIELQERYKQTESGCPTWLDENWKIVGRYKAETNHDVLGQAIDELRNRGIFPL